MEALHFGGMGILRGPREASFPWEREEHSPVSSARFVMFPECVTSPVAFLVSYFSVTIYFQYFVLVSGVQHGG